MINRLLIFLVLALATGCAGHQKDPRLQRIAETVSDSPESAIASLDSIDASGLSESDRHFKDFLTVKALDKAYVLHTSDSLILDVIDYAKSHKKDGYYPEAVYYGGRVYSDLGDLPTALRYYQDALDLVPADKENALLRTRILVQTARILDRLRLYDDAICLMKEALEMDIYSHDTEGLVYNLQLTGVICLRSADNESAERYLRLALDKGYSLSDSFRAKTKMSLAAIKKEKGCPDSALLLIRGIPDRVDSVTRNTALAHAALIYMESGIKDTAMRYAKELIERPNKTNKKMGYRVLLSPDIALQLSPDTLAVYIREYADLLNDYYDGNLAENAIIQHNVYNYDAHERDKVIAQNRASRLGICIYGLIIVILILFIVILILKNRNKSNLLNLHDALDRLSVLRTRLDENLLENINLGCIEMTDVDEDLEKKKSKYLEYNNTADESSLRLRLRNNLLALYENGKSRLPLNSTIYNSDAYERLQEYILEKRVLKEEDSLWKELEKVILMVSPDFKNNLKLLVRGRLSVSDYHTALLIRCGIGTVNIGSLLSLSKGAVVSRRSSLAMKVFDEKMSVKIIDGIICCI